MGGIKMVIWGMMVVWLVIRMVIWVVIRMVVMVIRETEGKKVEILEGRGDGRVRRERDRGKRAWGRVDGWLLSR